ncbi:MAG: T9SS type A sorting domain-containing protein [Flavobacteriales bacterium]|nr:T9SS type A sorting domain-containing protein [Flavobacteriales bacterium]
MKRYGIVLCLLLGVTGSSFGKKVKFAVDMSNEVVMTTGVHISGDFQVAAGYASDWCAECTPLLQEGSSNIYSVVVDIPAFAKYEYKFLNGDQFYEAEFVPEPSRVGYDFNDNRWLYVDSIADDTTFVGNIIFAANAPSGKLLMRLLVDMQKETVDAKGVHLAGSFQSWNTQDDILYHFDAAPADIHERIVYVDPGAYEYKYYNGDITSSAETVPGTCATNTNRAITMSVDSVLPAVCFSGCSDCSTAGIRELRNAHSLKIYPNPARESFTISFRNMTGDKTIAITDISGKVVRRYAAVSGEHFQVNREEMSSGTYIIHVLYNDRSFSSEKLIIE